MTDLAGYLDYKFPAGEDVGDERRMACPKCEKEKERFFVNRYTGAYECKHCGYRGNSWISLIASMEGLETRQDIGKWISGHKEDLTSNRPASSVAKAKAIMRKQLPSAAVPVTMDDPYIRYLNKRGIDYDTAVAWNVYKCESGKYCNRLIFPVEEDAKLVYFVDRIIDDKLSALKTLGIGNNEMEWPISKSKVVFGLDWITENAPVYVCEGIIDAISLVSITGRPTVALLGKVATAEQVNKILRRKPKQVIVCLDAEAISYSIKLAEQFLQWGSRTTLVCPLAEGDPNDYLVNKWELPPPVAYDTKFKILFAKARRTGRVRYL